jgi:uncharacterized membrane protein
MPAFVMSWVYFYGKSPFSLVGVSVCAAYTHTLTTVICVYFFWIQQEFIFKLLPVFFMFTLIAGILTGITGNFIVKKLTERDSFIQLSFKKNAFSFYLNMECCKYTLRP